MFPCYNSSLFEFWYLSYMSWYVSVDIFSGFYGYDLWNQNFELRMNNIYGEIRKI